MTAAYAILFLTVVVGMAVGPSAIAGHRSSPTLNALEIIRPRKIIGAHEQTSEDAVRHRALGHRMRRHEDNGRGVALRRRVLRRDRCMSNGNRPSEFTPAQ